MLKLPKALSVTVVVVLLSAMLSAPSYADLIGPPLPGTADRRSTQISDTTFVQTSLNVPGSVVSAPIVGTVTGFNMRIGTVYSSSTLQFWVLRPFAGGYMPVASTAVVTALANSMNHVPANIPVMAGDHIGLSEPTGNDMDTPDIDALGGTNTWFNGIPTAGVPLTGGTDQSGSVFPFNADFTPTATTHPDPPPPDTTAPPIDLTSPGSKSTYRRLTKVSLTTEPGASVEMALLKCLGSKCSATAGTAGKSKGKKKGMSKCRALVKKKSFYYLGGKSSSCSFGKVKAKPKNLHSISIDSAGSGTFKLAGKLKGKKNKKGLAIPGSYILYVQATDTTGNTALETKRFRIKRGK